ncbi:DExH-box ATP-dependent RNA helicase DExH18, mitochondrial [Beta vulgaris subsp. vulgaris]|uniref:DExH-box ATP-dependent RNA helicase DExH18, mitochondrial n=1 Tax=Beta vulgaris subsp. vulgaris TaxID=3555 RepID=UPI0020372872|nr:DExH-box ATP-dependent RNA helicase DExH18, mitochondrial [Beta vulgaris subsp. vulgaris]XP_010682138.2 DExH-box ATP-dependent RNA helicase DExH18, mitochondrial [Beta vulgaris subsp. vulgaris]XP_010682139.2 DExH-box ATP-dependent RNA helicase DExH18, mitochondrial [Beta vulgaris subsp. vulgaris]XP_048501968.1 DExH-box ATP-dependent RNA helicase DExH18, mitochondrial [Beta vulgaris subsp. vulgaris]
MAGGRLSHFLRRYSSKYTIFQVRVLLSNPLSNFKNYSLSIYRLSSSSNSSYGFRETSSPFLPQFHFYGAKSFSTSGGTDVYELKADNLNADNNLVDDNHDNVVADLDAVVDSDMLYEHVDGELSSSKNYEGFEHVASVDPVEIYRQLCELPRDAELCREDWQLLHDIFGRLSRSAWASNQALAIYIGASFFPTAVQKFRGFFIRHCRKDIANYLLSLGPGDEADKFLFPVFVEYCIEQFPNEIKKFRNMVECADLTKPHTWFPFARAMKRKIVYHCGPTNSGKTYNALQRFMEAKKGVYCSPLRLLAMEVFDKVNALGVYCSLLTGQEKKLVPFSDHVACTVEMVSAEEVYDVAVIDEIQMMADPCRGFAWTRALLGLKADEIHLCGDPSVLNIVRKICSDTGDELVEQHYSRFKPLVVEAKTLLGDLRNVKSGDCVVAFSRREIFEVKLAIEKQTKHRCCVIYGALPPETRRQQATLFNDHDNEFDVLVASDAVGMGLNLNIKRVVFYSLSKYNGDKVVPVPASQAKQIAGRAGRRGSRYPDGLCTTLHLEDLDYLIECLKQPFQEVKKVGLFPFYEQVELFAGQLPNTTFAQLLDKFAENCRLDGSYFLCQQAGIKKVANMLEKVQGLSLEDRYNFCFAPVNIRDPKAMYHLLRFASSFSQKLPVNIAMGMPKGSAKNDSELLDLETKHQVCSMYLWLSNHFREENFPYKQRAESMASNIAELLGESLTKACWKPESRGASKKPEQKDGYERPQSLIQVFDKKRQDESLAQDKSDKAKKTTV